MTERLTDAIVAAIKPAAKDVFRFDRLLSGYGVRVTPAGARILFAQARFAGRKIRHAVGHWPDVKVAVGRELAGTALADIRAGRDPKFERKARARAVAAGGRTVAEFAETWLREHVRIRLKANTYTDYESRLRLHILPRVGQLPVAGLRHGMTPIGCTPQWRPHHGPPTTPSTSCGCYSATPPKPACVRTIR